MCAIRSVLSIGKLPLPFDASERIYSMKMPMRLFLVFSLMLGALASPSLGQTPNAKDEQKKAPQIAGDWQGTLQAGGSQLRVVLHITKNYDGGLSATLDSPDQGAYGLVVNSISFKDTKLTFSVASVGGQYTGDVSGDATAIKGTWTQMQPMDLTFTRIKSTATSQKPVAPSDIDGAWFGALDLGAMKLRLVFHITNTADGLKTTLDSLDQGAKGIPASATTRSGPALNIQFKQLDGVFEGKISNDLTTITGTWTQHGSTHPLVLAKTKDLAALEPKRPQNPVRPFPYREEEVSYTNKLQGDTLAGTLTIPPGAGPFPAVLLITGSGPQDRDESLMGHKPFLVLSDWLTRKGIEVLRVDDRGVGKSTGVFGNATTADFATDAEAGVAFLESRPEVNPKKIGLIGHSEGAIIAPMVAARNHDVGFIVMLSGSALPGADILAEQKKLIEEASGVSKEQAETDAAEERGILALIVKEKDSPDLQKDLRGKLAAHINDPELGAQVRVLTSPWFLYFLAYDPAPALEHVQCPVLALNGAKDLQVPPSQNLPVIRKALQDGGNKNHEVDELPGLNHLFQTASTGAPSEYAQIEETMSPLALEKISTWILRLP
jgi:uncharacterized protein